MSRGEPRGIRLTVLTFLAAAGLAPIPILAADPGSVSGVVRDTGGAPLAGVEVVLVEQWERGDTLREREVSTVVTDDEGRYAFTARDASRKYVLRLSRPGSMSFETELRLRPRRETLLDLLLPAEEEQDELSQEAVEAINSGVNAMRAGQLPQAVSHFRQAVELAPESVAAHLALAELLMSRGEARAAAPLADTAVELDPDNLRALRVRSQAYDALAEGEGEDEKAKAKEARAAYEAVAPAAVGERLLAEAEAAYNRGALDVAEKRLTGLLEREPDQPRAHFLLSLCRIYQGDPAAAAPHLERFLDLAPDSPDAATARDLLAGLKNPDLR